MTARPSRQPALESPLLLLDEAAAYLRHGRTWTKQHAAELGAIRAPGKLLFRRETLDEWLARHQVQPAAPEPEAIAAPVTRPVLVHQSPVNPVTRLPWGEY